MKQIDQLSNARIVPLRGQMPVCDIECVDDAQGIWKGTCIPTQGMPDDMNKTVFFSRKYDRENNDFDRIVNELEITDTSILGIRFWLIPKEKMLFGYEPASTILKAPIQPVTPFRRPQ